MAKASAQTTFSAPTNPRTFNLGPGVVRFQWDRGDDNVWFCVDTAFTASDLVNLTGSWHNWGCGTTGTTIDAFGIRCDTPHYWRVYARGVFASGYSTIATFVSGGCGFSPPSDIQATPLAPEIMRFSWDRGGDNQFFCVDTAFTLEDLVGLSGSWHNWGCGTTGTAIDAWGIRCGTEHFWRVWARGTVSSGYSPTGTFTSPACPFSPPTNLLSEALSPSSILFAWSPGINNIFFCVDTAKSLSDLTSVTGTFANHGCGTTDTFLIVTGLECGTTYYWRVWAQGWWIAGASAAAQATTKACATPTPTATPTSTPTVTPTP